MLLLTVMDYNGVFFFCGLSTRFRVMACSYAALRLYWTHHSR